MGPSSPSAPDSTSRSASGQTKLLRISRTRPTIQYTTTHPCAVVLTDTAAATWPDQARGPRAVHGRADRSAIPRTQPPDRAPRRRRGGSGAGQRAPARDRRAAHAATHGPRTRAHPRRTRPVPVCACYATEALLSVLPRGSVPRTEVVACRAARPPAPLLKSPMAMCSGALAIGGGARAVVFRVGRHMRGLALPGCRSRSEIDTGTQRRGLAAAARRARALVCMYMTCARRHQHGCRRDGLRFGAASAVSLSPRPRTRGFFGLERWWPGQFAKATRDDGLATPWPMCASLVGGRPWSLPGFSLVYRLFLRHFCLRGHRSPVDRGCVV